MTSSSTASSRGSPPRTARSSIVFPTATKDEERDAAIFHPDDPRLPRIREIVEEKAKLDARSSELGRELSEIAATQIDAMYDGTDELHYPGWSRKTGPRKTRSYNNDAERALVRTEAIAKNVFGRDDLDPAKEDDGE